MLNPIPLSQIVERNNLEDVEVIPLAGGGEFISARCPRCRRALEVYLAVQVSSSEVSSPCQREGEAPHFTLVARRSSRSADADGVEIWGVLPPPLEERVLAQAPA